MINEFPDPMTFNAEVFGTGMMGHVLEIGDHLHVITIDMEWLASGHSKLLKEVVDPQGVLYVCIYTQTDGSNWPPAKLSGR